jgi:SWI/SNF-related matrix-associated actin-dependent regulator 1 of chromatin subfamily A
LISGTPAVNRPKELFNILSILRPNVFNNFKEYANRYCDPKPKMFGPPGIDYSGSSNIKELKYVM